MPLVPVAEERRGGSRAEDLARRARKVQPHYARGGAQRVTVVRNQAEGELVQGLLLEEGIPSILRRTGGFDVPDMLAAGPRDVMVPASGVEAARELLGIDPAAPAPEAEPLARTALRIAAVLLIVLLIVGLVTGTLYTLAR